MDQLHIKLYVSAYDAVAAGETRYGIVSVPVTSSLLEALSQHERKVLVTFNAGNNSLNVPNTSEASIVAAVRAIATQEAEKEAEKAAKAAQLEALLTGPREARLECDAERAPGTRWSPSKHASRLCDWGTGMWGKIKDEAHRTNMEDALAHDGALLDESPETHVHKPKDGLWCVDGDVSRKDSLHGGTYGPLYPRAYARADALATSRNKEAMKARKDAHEAVLKVALSAEQWERHGAKVLPQDERDQAMQAYLFAWCELPVFVEAEDRDLEHHPDCCRRRARRTENTDADISEYELSASQYAAAKRVLGAYQSHPQLDCIDWVRYTADCDECDAEIVRYAARVTLSVGDKLYACEYGLDDLT